MRYFNTLGPVNDKEHYVVPRSELVAELVAQIEQGRYFTIYAPRQMGKTTLLRQVQESLGQRPNYLPVPLSLGDYETLPADEFLPAFWSKLSNHIVAALQATAHPAVDSVQELLQEDFPTNFVALRMALDELHKLVPEQKIVLILDEFDGVPQPAIAPLLQVLRETYLATSLPHSLHSVLLVGLQNIATLNLGRSSPFNIASQLHLQGFSPQQVAELMATYEAESGQLFGAGVANKLANLTGGHPFLVNRLAAMLTEEIAIDRDQPISHANLAEAERRILRERNFNFETLGRHAKEYRKEVLGILFGNPYHFNLNNPLIHELHMHGIIRENAEGLCEIANPTYRQVLIAYLRPLELPTQGDLLVNGHDSSVYAHAGKLDMVAILSNFRTFIERRGREAFKISPMPQEATGQYLLMAYLESIVRQIGGAVFTEAPSGGGFLDLVLTYEKQRYIIETKIWRGPKKFDEGLTQLADYLETEGQITGYYVIFHARPNVYGKLANQELEYLQAHQGKDIHVYLVRLGQVFSDLALEDL